MENKQERTYAGMTRRTLCLGAGGAAVMLGLGGLKYAGSQSLVRPPGGQDEERLISACIRCEKCYEICPRDVIAPAHIEDGVLEVSVRDNGIGCKSVTPGFGLQHMQERMLMLGGTFWYENSDGFCIRAEIPLRKTPGSEKRKQEETV